MKKAIALVLAFFGLKELPTKEGKYHLNDEQKDLLNKAMENDSFADDFLAKANEHLDAEALSEEQRRLGADLKQVLEKEGISFSEGEKPSLEDQVKRLSEQLAEKNRQIKALGELDDESGLVQLQHNGKKLQELKHSKTHLYGSGQSYDAFENRPWNQNALKIGNGAHTKISATDWNDKVNIEQINQDLGEYWRRELDQVLDFMQDYRGVPAWWNVISNISDEISYTALMTAEVTQGRAKNWLAKNKQKFVAIKGKVFDIKIDLEWSGFDLQKIERSWMNRYNREGSQAYKMSFVRFLTVEILKKARQEDSIALIKGVYAPDVDREEPQSFLFRERGLLQLIKENRFKTYLPFSVGKPTASNIVDYVKEMCSLLPDEKKSTPGLIFYMAPDWERKYKEKRKLEDGLMPTYEPGEMTVENFPNVRIYGLEFLEGEDLMFITTEDNISILQNIEREKSLLKFEMLKRYIYAFGDYKQGAHVDAFGAQWEDGNPVDYNSQQFWSNDVEVLLDVKLPLTPNDTTPSVKYHNVVVTGANTQTTAITNLDDAVDGEFYYVYGNNLGTAATIANGTNFDLSASITLDGSTMIKLYKSPGGKLVEIERVDISKNDAIYLDAGATTADASQGTRFITQANSGATALTDITNAVKDTVYRIEGGSDTNATTIAKSGKFDRISAGITLEEGVFIEVVWNGASFVELKRG